MNFWRRLFLRMLRVEVTFTKQAELIRSRPCIVVCNHQSMIDGVVIALAVQVNMDYAVTPKYAVNNVTTKRLLEVMEKRGLGRVVPLSAENAHSIRSLRKSLISGRSVMIFPTGKITPGEEKRGYEWLSIKTGCPVVRASISGADKSIVFSRKGKNIWPKINLTI